MRHSRRIAFISCVVVLAAGIFTAACMAATSWMENIPAEKQSSVSIADSDNSSGTDGSADSSGPAPYSHVEESSSAPAQNAKAGSGSSSYGSNSLSNGNIAAKSSVSFSAGSVNQSTSDAKMQTVCADDYYLTVPSNWKVEKTDPLALEFSFNGKTVGSVMITSYYPSEPFSQLFDNHTEVLSQKKLSGFCLPVTEVLLRHTQPVASGDTSHVDKFHFYFVAEGANTAYDLSFVSPVINEKTALQIAGSFQRTEVEIIDNAYEELKSVCGDVTVTNMAFFKEEKNYVLFGSLKSNPAQGVAVVFKSEFTSDGKGQIAQRYLTPQKHGAVKVVCGGAKDTNATVTAADGCEWTFNLYNGFQGGKSGFQTSTVSQSSGETKTLAYSAGMIPRQIPLRRTRRSGLQQAIRNGFSSSG